MREDAGLAKPADHATTKMTSTTSSETEQSSHNANTGRTQPMVGPLGISLLDTNVSRHVGTAPQQVFPGSYQQSLKGSIRRDSESTSLHPTSAVSSSIKRLKKNAPAPLSLDSTLTPSDREVPIILSLETRPATSWQQAKHRDISQRFQLDSGQHQQQQQQQDARTPTIVVTPSEETKIQPYLASTGSISRKLRQASSIYSQGFTPYIPAQRTPAMPPPIPLEHQRHNPQMPQARLGPNEGLDEKHESICTDFDDDGYEDERFDSSRTDEKTPLTAEARANRFSRETILPTPQRSFGWWNMLTSPIFGRSSLSSMTRSLSFADDAPDFPRRTRSSSLFTRARGLGGSSPADLTSPLKSPYQQPLSARLEPVGEAAEYFDVNKSFASPDLPPQKADKSSPSPPEIPSEHPNESDPKHLRWPGFHSDDNNSLQSPMSVHDPTEKHYKNVEFHEIHTHHITHRNTDESLMSPTSPSPVVGVASVGFFRPARQVDALTPSPRPVQETTMAQRTLLPAPLFNERPRVDLQPSPKQSETSTAPVVPSPFYNTPSGAARNLNAISTPSPPPPLSQSQLAALERSAPPPFMIRDFETSPSSQPPPLPPPPSFDPSPQEPVQVPQLGRTKSTNFSYRKPYQDERMAPPERPMPAFLKNMDKRSRCIVITLGIIVGGFITLALVLGISKTRSTNDDIPAQASWFNVTNFPPMPTGIMTVANTQIAPAVSGCVDPPEMWSCNPSGEVDGQPSFRIEIRYADSTSSDQSLHREKRHDSSTSHAALAAHLIHRRRSLEARSELSSTYFTPNPAPPTLDEQRFLGHTSDQNRGTVEGEATSFYISFLPTTTPSKVKRDHDQDQLSTQTQLTTYTSPSPSSTPNLSRPSQYLNLSSSIPQPALAQNGSAVLPPFFPFPHAQPVRLYNRGLDTEHYGFYTYFDRTALLHLPSESNTTATSNAPIGLANALCTFSQTRFKVSIFTKKPRTLLSTPPNSPSFNVTTLVASNGTSSAEDFVRPGSFPLPITIALDRHGGDPSRKAVYCYAVETSGLVNTARGIVYPENRGFDGGIVGATGSPFEEGAHVALQDGGLGGVDGGMGGCKCSYSNFES